MPVGTSNNEISWYEDQSSTENQPIEHSTDLTSNPYQCTLTIKVTPEQTSKIKRLYTPLLQGIDPTFQLIQIESCKDDELGTACGKIDNDMRTMGLPTQSLSIILFLRDNAYSQLTAEPIRTHLHCEPWSFHHKIELTSRYDVTRVVARQEFYECAPRHHLPLWSICSVHCGNEQMRFNIFVKDFNKMEQFYSMILRRKALINRSGFCLFRIYSQPGLEIQLSLKHSPCLVPEPTIDSFLSFVVQDASRLHSVLPYKVLANDDSTWWTRDPDGNKVLIRNDNSSLDRY